MKEIPQSVIDRVRKAASLFSGNPAPCWMWPKYKNPQTGYGQLSAVVNGKRMLFTAHRAAYAALVADIHDGMHVLHRCDNRACFNPWHLFLGTHAENMRDMMDKGRGGQQKNRARGERHGSRTNPQNLKRGEGNNKAKLTERQVQEILTSPEGPVSLARKFGVAYNAIWAIRKRLTWKHVNPSV